MGQSLVAFFQAIAVPIFVKQLYYAGDGRRRGAEMNNNEPSGNEVDKVV